MCFAFEGRVAVGDKADGIDAELQALGVIVVVRDNRRIHTRQQPDRLQELADGYREEDDVSTPDLDNILQRLPPTNPLKRDASQAELNAA